MESSAPAAPPVVELHEPRRRETERSSGRVLDPRPPHVLVGVVHVDEARAARRRIRAIARANSARVCGSATTQTTWPSPTLGEDFDGKACIALASLFRRHRRESLQQAALLVSCTVTSTVETPVRKPRAGDPGSGLDAPWQVIVLNDDHNTFDGVAHALAAVLPGRRLRPGHAPGEQDPLERPRGRLVGPEGAGGALLGAAAGTRADDGSPRTGRNGPW